MNWRKYLEPTKESANLFLEELKKFGHVPAERDGEFIDCIQISDADYKHKEKVPADSEVLWEQNEIITESLKQSGFYDMVVGMMDYFYPIQTSRINNNGLGCSCGICGNKAWESDHPDVTIMSTINGAVGCAEGIVHELGHYKFHAVGINLEDWDQDIIGNAFDEVYKSPVRYDKLRPMGAVMHAEFSYVYVTKFYIPLIQKAISEGSCLGASLNTYRQRQAYNLKRIGNGIHTIKEHYTGDADLYDEFMVLSVKTWNEAFRAFEGCEDEYDWEPVKGRP